MLSTQELLLIVATAIPLAAFVILAVFGSRLGKPLAGWCAVAAIAVSTVLAGVVLKQWLHGVRDEAHTFTWATLGRVPITVGLHLDALTVIMFFMVSLVSTCIFVFSVGYMAGHSDEIDGRSKYHRFFTFLCLFCFSMLGLVVSNSILFLFVFWELVGLCSYFLIGFYFHRKSASNAAIKAFVVNRVGDFGFLAGLMMVFHYLGDLSLAGAAAKFQAAYPGGELFTRSFLGLSLATWMGMLLFCGAIGKSAQFPLHVWLPDAMEGPTPVSALIHAATMVAAGVYLVARIFVLLTPEAQLFIAVIGCITLTIAALVAIVQTDIKKVLAYSTISQLGYMIFGMGVGAWIGALFHLLTHAFFKALMFLGSGQVIEGCHHEQDIRRMGGLIRKMPVTGVTFLVGVLAIAGAGIPGLHIGGVRLGLGGFFSKDEILAVAYQRAFRTEEADAPDARRSGPAERPPGEPAGAAASVNPRSEATADAASGLMAATFADAAPSHLSAHDAAAERTRDSSFTPFARHDRVGGETAVTPEGVPPVACIPAPLFWIPVLIAFVTPFYMMRCWWLTFMGKPRDRHVYEHAHETPLMGVPLVVLAIGTFVSSYAIFRPMVAQAAPAGFLCKTFNPERHHEEAERPAASREEGAESADHAVAAGLPVAADVHGRLSMIVGPAFVVGFFLAIAIYLRGLLVAGAIASSLRPLHTLLVRKFYFDELYGAVFVGGIMGLKSVCDWVDTHIVDGLVNLCGRVTRAFSSIAGNVLDRSGTYGVEPAAGEQAGRLGGFMMLAAVLAVAGIMLAYGATGAAIALLVMAWVALGIDGIVNDLARGAWQVATSLRAVQSGRIRQYVLFAAGSAAVVLLVLVLL